MDPRLSAVQDDSTKTGNPRPSSVQDGNTKTLTPTEEKQSAETGGTPADATHKEKEWKSLQKDRIPALRAQVLENEWDDSTLKDLLSEGEFEFVMEKFPTYIAGWLKWLESARKEKSHAEITRIFEKCIRSTPDLKLYREYLAYITFIHNPENLEDEDEMKKAQNTITSTYDYVLSTIGTDKESGDIWLDYINFVKNMKTSGSYEDQQKMDLLRKIFHKAVWVPMDGVEEVWKEYDKFENSLSKLTAKKFISDQAGGYMTARGAIKDLSNLLDPLAKLSSTWIPKIPTWTAQEQELLNIWKTYIAYETSNPLALESPGYYARVNYAFKKALLDLRHFSEIWIDYYNFLLDIGKVEESLQVLRQGLEANPKNLLITFTLVEVLESRKVDFKEIQEIFDHLLSQLEGEYASVMARFDKKRNQLYAYLKETFSTTFDDLDEGERRERERELKKEHDREVESRVEKPREKNIEIVKKGYTLTWIVYMRLTRRSQSIKAARLVFSKARKSELITSHVFVASALMEFYVNKDPVVAGKIFEVGLKTFPLNEDKQAVGYVIQYLDFLMCLNDDNNTRALFERALQAVPEDKSHPIWKKYIDYETQYGDLTNLYGIESRFKKVADSLDVNSIESLEMIAAKYKYFDLDYIEKYELGVEQLRKRGRVSSKNVKGTSRIGAAVKDSATSVALLVGVNAEKFPKPDLTRWQLNKPGLGNARVAQIVSKESDAGVVPVGSPIMKRDNGGSLIPPSTGTILVPEQIANLMAALPRKETYNGPLLQNSELLAVIFNMPIPQLQTPVYVPAPAGFSEKPQRKRGRYD